MFEQMQKWFSAVQGDEEELLKDYASIDPQAAKDHAPCTLEGR